MVVIPRTEKIEICPGVNVEVRYKEVDIMEMFCGKREQPFDTTLVVRYQKKKNAFEEDDVFVDRKAEGWYKTLAALHLMIFSGFEYRMFVPDTFNVPEDEVCACVEKFVVSLADESYRKEFIKKRKQMYSDMLEFNIYDPKYEKSIDNTLRMLNELSGE